MSESKTNPPTYSDEEVSKEVDRINSKMRHVAIYQVGMPKGDDDYHAIVRRDIATRFMLLLEELKKEYPELTLDYNVAYMMRTPEKISLD
jgi:hypothetical protein